tara:strand:- start:389 stop:625 length:237 start_codon:yes stop_codon:yes gene_type:complete
MFELFDIIKENLSEVGYIAKKKIPQNKAKWKHHMWDGEDTLCRLASTGGLNIKRYESSDPSQGGSVCKMCRDNYEKRN